MIHVDSMRIDNGIETAEEKMRVTQNNSPFDPPPVAANFPLLSAGFTSGGGSKGFLEGKW